MIILPKQWLHIVVFSPNRICYHCSFFSEKSNIPITTKHCIFPYNISHYLTGLTLKTGLVSLQNTQLQSTFALVYVQSLDTRKITGCQLYQQSWWPLLIYWNENSIMYRKIYEVSYQQIEKYFYDIELPPFFSFKLM